MQQVTLTVTVSPDQATSILAGLKSTDATASGKSHTSSSPAPSATNPGKTSPKQAAPSDDEDYTEETYGDDEPEATEPEETEEVDYTAPQVSKLMAKLAEEKDAATCKKLLAKYKVKAVKELKQPKLNQLHAEITSLLE